LPLTWYNGKRKDTKGEKKDTSTKAIAVDEKKHVSGQSNVEK